MTKIILNLTSLFSATALLLLGLGLVNTLVPLKGEASGFSIESIGLLMSGYFIGFFLGTFLAQPMVERIGYIRSFAICAAILSASVLFHLLTEGELIWFLIRVISGLSIVILYTVLESWLIGQPESEHRGKIFASYMCINLGALAFSQQLIQLDPQLKHTLFLISAILVGLSLIPIAWTRLPQPEIHKIDKLNIQTLNQVAPVALYGSLFAGFALGAFWALAAVFGVRIGLAGEESANLITATIIGGVILQFLIGRYSDNADRKKVLFLVSTLATATALVIAIPFFWKEIPLYLLLALFGGLTFSIYPISIAHLVDHLETEKMLSGASSLLLVHGVGAAIGPILASHCMSLFGPSGLPLYWALCTLVLCTLSCYHYMTAPTEAPDEYAADFVPMIRTTPSAFELLPPDEDLSEDNEAAWSQQNIDDLNQPNDNN